MALIKGSWENMHIVCGNHKDEGIEMEIKAGPHSMFYNCPHYKSENIQSGERPCYNRINLVECEAMLSQIAEWLIDAEQNGQALNLANHTWEKKGIVYKILSCSDREIVVSVLNKRAITGTRIPI